MRALLAVTTVAGVLTLAACGEEPPADEEAEETGADLADVEDVEADTDEASVDEADEITIVDDAGRVVDLEVPVESIVPFNLRNIEFVRSVDAMDLVVGVGDSVLNEPEYWPDLDPDVPGVGSQGEPDYEALAELAPDVVIIPRNGAWEEAEAQLAPFDIEIVVLTGWDLVQHEHTVSNMGLMFDRRAEAEAVNDFYHHYRDLMDERLADIDAVPLYLEKAGDFDTAIPGSGWHDMVAQAGGRNIFEDMTEATETGAGTGSVHTFPVEPETVLAREPEIAIKLTSDRYEGPEEGELDALAQEILARPGWDTLPLAADENVHVITGFVGDVASKIVGSLYIANWMHPDVFDDVDPDEAMREWVEDFQGVPFDHVERHRSALPD